MGVMEGESLQCWGSNDPGGDGVDCGDPWV